MNGKVAALEVEQPAGPAEIVQQMPIDMEQIRIVPEMGDDMLVPDFSQQRAAGLFQGMSSPFGPLDWRLLPPAAVLHGLLFEPWPIKACRRPLG
jgi:hypothetical protein